MKESYSSGVLLRSVPGSRRSTSLGDWPDEVAESVAYTARLVLVLSAPNLTSDSDGAGA